MRFLVLVPLVLVLAAGVAFAQAGGQQKVLPGFTPEDMQSFMKMEGELREAFDYKDYAKALPLLDKQLVLLETALGRIREKEATTDEEKKQKEGTILGMTRRFVAGVHYNRACCLSQLEKKEEAVAAFKKGIECGYIDLDKFRIDSDLDNIRNTPEYKKVIADLDYNEVYEVYTPESAGGTPAGIIVGLHWSNLNEKKFLERFKVVADETRMVLVVPRAPVTIAPDAYDWSRRSDDKKTGLKKIDYVISEMKKRDGMADLPVYLLGIGSGGGFATIAAFEMPAKVKGALQVNSYWNKYYVEDLLPKAKEAGVRIAMIHGKKNAFFPKAEAGIAQMSEKELACKLIEFDGDKKLPENEAELIKQGIDFLAGK